MSLIRARQSITRVFPHQGNRRFIVPNRLGAATTTLFEGLVSQSDVDTDGRSDAAPFDHILNNVATLQNAPAVITGDGGFSGMDFVTAEEKTATLPPPAIDYTASLTYAFRAKTSTGIADNSCVGLGNNTDAQPLLAGKITRDAGGNAEAFLRSNGGQATFVSGTLGGNNDGDEHVITIRSLGGGTSRVQLVVDLLLSGDDSQTFGGATTIDNMVWGGFLLAGVYAAWGTNEMFWLAVWDRLLSNDEIVALNAKPNPFGRSP